MNDFWKVGDSCPCIVARFTGIKRSRCGEGSAEEQKKLSCCEHRGGVKCLCSFVQRKVLVRDFVTFVRPHDDMHCQRKRLHCMCVCMLRFEMTSTVIEGR